MTNEEAIKVLTAMKTSVMIEQYCFDIVRVAIIDAIDIAIAAVNKQIPAKPEQAKEARFGMGHEYYDWVCPTCGRFLAFEPSKGDHHCTCGQTIDWD